VTLNLDPAFPRTRERIIEWSRDPAVLGVLLVGSRSRGHQDAWSDDDLEVLLLDEAFARLTPDECIEIVEEEGADPPHSLYDAQFLPLGEIERRAHSAIDLDHWPYERAIVLFDRDGRTARAAAAAGRMDPGFRAARLRHAALDALIPVRRAAKMRTRGVPLGMRALAHRSVRALLRVVFALEGRWVPLEHWLDRELATLADEAAVVPLLREALETGGIDPLERALERLAAPLDREGFPAAPAERRRFFIHAVHPGNAAERARHGLA